MKQRLKTPRKFARLADELEAIHAKGGPTWRFHNKYIQFGDAEDRYEGTESIKPYRDRVDAVFDKFWAEHDA